MSESSARFVTVWRCCGMPTRSAATCRHYGLSRHVFYKWQRRVDELGEAGLRDGSSRPRHSSTATDPEIVGKVIYLRRHYHFGPG